MVIMALKMVVVSIPEYKSRSINLLLSINVIFTPFITIVSVVNNTTNGILTFLRILSRAFWKLLSCTSLCLIVLIVSMGKRTAFDIPPARPPAMIDDITDDDDDDDDDVDDDNDDDDDDMNCFPLHLVKNTNKNTN